MSGFFTPRNIAIAAGGAGALYMLFPRSAKAAGISGNVFETPGVKNVGNRMSAGGGTNTHTPGVATPLGDPNNVKQNQENPSGVGTPAFDKSHADQKFGESSGPAKQFYQAHTGNDKGK